MTSLFAMTRSFCVCVTCLAQITMNAWAAIDSMAVFEEFPDVCHEGFISQGTCALGSSLPRVIAAALNT